MTTGAPITIHYQQMEEWLNDRKSVFARAYKKPFATLLRLAPRLVQLVHYDIPAMQKRARRNADAVAECQRVCEEAERSMVSAGKKRAAFLHSHGLSSAQSADDTDTQICDLVADRDGATEDIEAAVELRVARACRGVTAALLQYARMYLPCTCACYDRTLHDNAPERFAAEGSFRAHFPWLARLQHECDLPPREDADDAASEAGAACAIDWGEAAAATSDSRDAVVQVDWDADVTAVSAAGRDDVDCDALPPQDHAHLSLDVARGTDRVNLVTELRAVHSFLREHQVMHSADHEAGGGQQEASDVPQLAGLIEATGNMLATLSSSSDAEFVRMRHNRRARNELVDTLRRFDHAIATAQARRASHERKAAEAAAEVRALEPQLAELRTSARRVRDECLAQLALIFPDRTVNIVGDITRLIG